ncbi:hypothetical protein C5S53_11595 [Methanophagales archaeon]|nr:hypothetical protein C5S53_11595 [Methanophagales archaeon]
MRRLSTGNIRNITDGKQSEESKEQDEESSGKIYKG